MNRSSHGAYTLLDVGVALLLLLLINIAVTALSGPLRVLAGVTALVFLPGYALTTLVFPAATSTQETGVRPNIEQSGEHAALSLPERIAVSFGLSVTLIPLVGFAFSVGSVEIAPQPILLAVSGITFVSLLLGSVRRLRTPEDVRYAVPVRTWTERARSGVRGNSVDVALNVGLAVAILIATGTLGYPLVAPDDGQQYTEAVMLTETDEGELVAEGYPTTFAAGESNTYAVRVTNHEQQTVTYSVVLQLQRVAASDNGTVVERTTLDEHTKTVSDGDSWLIRDEVTPTTTGDRFRLAYLIYKSSPPSNPTVDNSYRHLTLDVSVEGTTDAGGTANATSTPPT